MLRPRACVHDHQFVIRGILEYDKVPYRLARGECGDRGPFRRRLVQQRGDAAGVAGCQQHGPAVKTICLEQPPQLGQRNLAAVLKQSVDVLERRLAPQPLQDQKSAVSAAGGLRGSCAPARFAQTGAECAADLR